ncbi:MAG: NUDIX domain-containing protein [Eubacterium sp.]|nr:NUDIX domain-containing protein [Eubacterium sp.]
MITVKFYEEAADELLKFAVIAAVHEGKWVFCKHKDRNTLEAPGGHRESGERIDDTARRELYEETGAIEYDIRPVCVYSVVRQEESGEEETFGMLYYADIKAFEGELHYEIEKTVFMKELPDNWTYPEIQPKLLEKVECCN